MKKKIIFVQFTKFLDFHYNLYEVEYLKKYFDIDMTNVREHLDIVRKYNKNFINLFLRNYDIR